MNQIIWPGSGSNPSGSTNFGFYDNDTDFQNDAPRVASWVAMSIGYPAMDVEANDRMIYSNFEEAINEFSTQTNLFNIKENLITLQGSPTNINMTQQELIPNFGRMIKLSDMYGTEAGAGGNIDWKKGWIETNPTDQVYDLDALWANVSESNKAIEIKRVFHQEPAAASQIYDPSVGTGINAVLGEFGWTGMAPGITFLMMPVFENLLRMQTIELNNQIRKSAYTFELINNKLRILPKPSDAMKIYFDYIVKDARNLAVNSGSNVITDLSNAKYDMMEYTKINQPGKQWIRKYTLALTKIMIGNIRSKYVSIPIPNGEVTLNGDSLKSEGIEEKQKLIEQLREDLDRTSTVNQMNIQREQAEQLNNVLKNIPLPIYVM